jgi:hypothetical protein
LALPACVLKKTNFDLLPDGLTRWISTFLVSSGRHGRLFPLATTSGSISLPGMILGKTKDMLCPKAVVCNQPVFYVF